MKIISKINPLLRLALLLSLMLGLFLGTKGIPVTSAVLTSNQVGSFFSLPDLADFTVQVSNGKSNQVTGIYAEGIFALPVVQQPSGYSGFVSTTPDTVTQFSMATNFGSLGFLAHNTLAGKLFFNLSQGDIFTIIYGDGHQDNYIISQVRHFQALNPYSPYSNFKDLEKGNTLSATDLFYQTYGIKQQAILQTCIANNGNDSWGRMFIIATHYVPTQESISTSLLQREAIP